MNNICRFCLNVCNQEMYKLQECDIHSKIQSCLSLHISLEESFPDQICKKCINKVEQMYEFCSTVKENEQKLYQCFRNGSLEDYYLSLTNNLHVKEEKFGVCSTNEISKPEIFVNKKEYDTDLNNINFKIEESADYDCNETAYSSDDETLSSIKKDKELHKNVTKEKVRPKKNFKRKQLSERNTNTNLNNITQFSCLTCLNKCETQLDLIKHYHDEHFDKYKSTINLTYTINESEGNITYKCDNCKKTFNMKNDIEKHITVHNDERPLICKLCGRMYKTVTEIIRHARVHNGFRLQCSYKCGYSTAYRGALKEHENRHLDVYKYRCEKCGKGFHVKTWYEQHQNIHNGLKPFVCSICGLAFHMARYLTAHRSLIHPQSSSVKRYICVHCDHKCDSANSLALHLEVHGINKGKEFLCDFCGKVLSSANQLKNHRRMHSGEKPYSCSICNKSFAKKFNVKVHMSSHSGEKKHVCARCGKTYTQRSTLLRHQRRHHASSSPTRTG